MEDKLEKREFSSVETGEKLVFAVLNVIILINLFLYYVYHFSRDSTLLKHYH